MERSASRSGQCRPAVTPLRVVHRAAPGLALFLSLAVHAMAAPAPLIHVSTTGAAFVPTQVCASTTMTRGGILLGNVGDAPLVISSLTFTGPNAGDFSVTQGCVGTLQPHDLCNLILTFTPKAAGLRTAFLNINSNAAGSPFLLSVSGMGMGSGGGLSPGSVSFGNQAVGSTSAPQSLTLTNTGDTALNISSVTLTAGSPFAITGGGTAGSVPVGGTRTITVTFTPTATGSASATLTVATDAVCGTFTASLSGTGTAATGGAPAVSLTGGSFGNQCVGVTSAAQTVTLTNTGTADLNITSISLPSGSPFAITGGGTAGTLAAGASRSITVTVTPAAAGAVSADLTVASNAATSPNKLTLTATGVTSSSTATLTPATVPFGNQTVGTTSAAQNLTLTNTSGTALAISSIGLSSTAQFAITAGDTPGTLAAGASRTISVVFKPTAAGAQSTTLTVASAALCASLTATLTGTGQAVTGTGAVSLSRSFISFADLCVGKTAGPLCFTITNTGTGPLTINSIGFINCSNSIRPVYVDCATVMGLKVVSGGDAGTLAAGASRDVCITFSPGEAATFDGVVTIGTNAANSPSLVFLHGTGDVCPPQVSLTAPTFSTQCVGTTSAAQTVTLKNTGGSDLNISSITLNPNTVFKITGGDQAGTLAPGATRSITVTFTPTAAGVQTAELSVASNAASSPDKLTLTATGATSTATLAPGTVAFGNQTAGTTSAAQNLTLTNTSGGPLTIGSIALSGSSAFAITAGGTAGTLAAGASQTISVVFKPTTGGAQTATLTVSGAALCSSLTATLTGTGLAPQVSLTAPTFANQCVNTTSAAQTVTLTNTGTADLNITSITIPSGSPFVITGGNQAGTLAAGASRSITVTFTPTTSGVQTADLTVVSNAASSPNKLTLTATGITNASVATLTPATGAFGNQNVGTTSAAQNFTLTNTSGAPLTIGSIALSGSATFQITAGGTAGTLAAGASQTISVVFKPVINGAQTATLTVTSAALCGPLTATLTGTGTGGVSAVSASRSFMSFADICVGKTVGPLCFTITNSGTADLVINSIGVINCSSSKHPVYVDCATVAGFKVVSGGTAGTLAPGASRDVCLTFTPGEAATFDSTVTISTNAAGSPSLVTLHGTGDVCAVP